MEPRQAMEGFVADVVAACACGDACSAPVVRAALGALHPTLATALVESRGAAAVAGVAAYVCSPAARACLTATTSATLGHVCLGAASGAVGATLTAPWLEFDTLLLRLGLVALAAVALWRDVARALRAAAAAAAAPPPPPPPQRTTPMQFDIARAHARRW